MTHHHRTRRTACQPFDVDRVEPADEAFRDGRDAAALEHVAGYMAALDALHPDDVTARRWYRARLGDARTIAGLEPLPGGHLAAVD